METTTGPLGQGVGNAVGQALGLKLLAEKFNTDEHKIFTNKVFVLMGDGCAMEGVTSEVCSLAGHLNLNNLVLLYDANNVCLDGPLGESCSEDTKTRYLSYGWDVYEVNGHDFDSIDRVFKKIEKQQDKPCLVVCRTIIGKGAPTKAGSYKSHGSPLGFDEIKATKEALGIPQEEFYVPQSAYNHFKNKLEEDALLEEEWNELFAQWSKANPDKKQEFDRMQEKVNLERVEKELNQLVIKSPIAGRKASQECINAFDGNNAPNLWGLRRPLLF